MLPYTLDLEKAIDQYERLLQQTVISLLQEEDKMEILLINVIELRSRMRSMLEVMKTCRRVYCLSLHVILYFIIVTDY